MSTAMMRNEAAPGVEPDPSEPVIYPVEAYISEDYARAERDKLWRKVWLQAGRLEDIPEVGNYLTYDILDDSVLIVRTAPDTIKAYFNVCTHRGRRLIDTPAGARNARGKKYELRLRLSRLDLQPGGPLHAHPAKGRLERRAHGRAYAARARCSLDTWGGWIWINLDPQCGPLRDYLEPAAGMLDPFELQNMRCRWRKWIIFDCNWKVALEAFNETYHVPGTHPEFMRFGNFVGWAKDAGKAQQHGLRRTQGAGGEQGQAASRRGRRSAQVDGGDAALYLGACEHQHHQDARRCGAATGRRAAGRNAGRQSAQALARLRAA